MTEPTSRIDFSRVPTSILLDLCELACRKAAEREKKKGAAK